MKYKIKKVNNGYQVFEVLNYDSMKGKAYEPTLWQIATCRTRAEAKKVIDKEIQQRDVYDMNQITNYGEK